MANNSVHTSKEYPTDLTDNLQINLQIVNKSIGHNPDVIIREFSLANNTLSAALIYVDNLVDKQTVHAEVLRSLLLHFPQPHHLVGAINFITHIQSYLQQNVITGGETKLYSTLDDLDLRVLSGDTVLLVDGSKEFLVIGTRKYPARNVEEPVTEAVVRGPRDGFVESVRTNMALIRRRLRDPNLVFESDTIGRRARNEIVICYIKGIAKQELIDEVRNRLATLDIDEAPESGFIEELIEDNFLSVFPQLQHSERPDKVVTALLSGRVAILLDGTPFVLILPVSIGLLMQASEDYYERWMIGTLIRILHYFSAFVSVFLPAIYIALVSFHPGLLPTKLALSMAAAREGVPFPAPVEAFMMEGVVEILREAGLRLPRPIGQTVSIVGGLVIGQSAVAAGIVSPIMVIVVAVGAISSYSIPTYSVAIAFRILRFGLMAAASLLGLYGIIMAYIFLNIHLVRLFSFGTVFSAPFAPSNLRDWKDLVVRLPLTVFKKRPGFLEPDDQQRSG